MHTCCEVPALPVRTSRRRLFSVIIAAALWFSLPGDVAAQPQELPLGSSIPSVSASFTTADGGTVQLTSLLGQTATVFVFWSNQCPWVDRYESRVLALAKKAEAQGVAFVLVNSNDAATYPKESAEGNAQRAASKNYAVTYIRDDNAMLAKALGASRAPHAFVFDDNRTLVYAGTIDDSPASADNVQKPYLKNAIDAVVAGEDVPVADTKAFGCTLKFGQ